MDNGNIKLVSVTRFDYRFLYDLLKERDPRANISHHIMPSYKEHVEFIKTKPYKKWYIAKAGSKKIGSAYLTNNNEIGIFIKKIYQNKKYGGKILGLVISKNPSDRFLANVSPKNSISEKFFKNNGFKFIQKTFELRT